MTGEKIIFQTPFKKPFGWVMNESGLVVPGDSLLVQNPFTNETYRTITTNISLM